MRRATIVGAGIGGLTTAVGLRDAGWTVTVLERWPEVVGIGAALGLWPEARTGLATIGISESDLRAVPAGGAALYRADGRRLVAFPADSRRAPDVRLVSRHHLMELLLQRTHGIDLRTGVEAGGATFREAADGVLIGADGLHSLVRSTFVGDRTRPRYSGLIGWRGEVPFESGAYGETWGPDPAGGAGMLFGNTPVSTGRTNFYAAYAAPVDCTPDLGELRDRFAGWRDPIPAVVAAAAEPGDPAAANEGLDVRCVPIHDLHPALPSFVDGRVALLGDAAHAMTPHLGRGACEAITDATSLVRHLRDSAPGDEAAALAAYDTERRRPAQRIAARSWRMMRLAHAARTAPLRDAVVGTLGRVTTRR